MRARSPGVIRASVVTAVTPVTSALEGELEQIGPCTAPLWMVKHQPVSYGNRIRNHHVGGKDARECRVFVHPSQKLLAIVALDGGGVRGRAVSAERGMGTGDRPERAGCSPDQHDPDQWDCGKPRDQDVFLWQ
jgi:hypothetical protein